MTLLLREVVGLLTAALLWLAVVAALCAVPGIVVSRTHRSRSGAVLRVALVSGLLAAGLSARLGLPDPAGFAVAGRPVPALWTIAGATAGALLAGLGGRPVSDRTEG